MKARSKRLAAVCVGTLAAAAVGAGAAYAAIPGSDDKVHACYATTSGLLLGIPHSKGDLRAVDSAEACRSYERPLTWDQHGLKGDTGATGATGPAGPAGPTGPAGVAAPPSSIYRVFPSATVEFGTQVIDLNLPTGTWNVVVKGEAANFGIECFLDGVANGHGVHGDDNVTAQGTDTGDVVPFTLMAQMTFTEPGSAQVDCLSRSYPAHNGIVDSLAVLATEVTPVGG